MSNQRPQWPQQLIDAEPAFASQPSGGRAAAAAVVAAPPADGYDEATIARTSNGAQTVKTEAASGGYNIASAEVGSDLDGGYDAC